MKLNTTCLRDILIYCEKTLSFGEDLSWNPLYLSDFSEALSKYSKEDIAYTLLLLDEAGFIEAVITKYSGGIYDISVYRLTYKGHEFIEVVKPEPVWKKIQTSMSSIGSASLPVLQKIGAQYLLDILTSL